MAKIKTSGTFQGKAFKQRKEACLNVTSERR
jgi:hypothetical protein